MGWLTERRRRKLLETPFPAPWRQIIDDDVRIAARLDPALHERLLQLTQVFIAEKHWIGGGDLELDDRHRVVIGALACVLLLGRDHGLYADVESIIVYPSTVVVPQRLPRVFERGGQIVEPEQAILGQAIRGGPVVLAWDDVLVGAHERRTFHNVVFHELAHKLDMVDGEVDGTPPLDDRAHRREWAEVCTQVFRALQASLAAGRRTTLDDYAAKNEAEFFAVATELYFTDPEHMARQLPELHALFKAFYRVEIPRG
jgi:Mlc titration factor MtfA (ptsG expression regulator)